MNRRWIFKLMAAAAVAVPLADRKAAAAGEKKAHRSLRLISLFPLKPACSPTGNSSAVARTTYCFS
jgi:hypothetical protein